jgi:hypothetical protein
MTYGVFNQSAVKSLVGRRIIAAVDNHLELDNGLIIYLDDSEIEMLNS